MDVSHVDCLYQRLEVGPAVIVGGWHGMVDTVHLDPGTGRLTIECIPATQVRREAADLSAALHRLPDPVDLVARQDEPPERR